MDVGVRVLNGIYTFHYILRRRCVDLLLTLTGYKQIFRNSTAVSLSISSVSKESRKPMKLLFLLTWLMLPFVLQEQLDDQRDPRLVVLKFSWAKEVQIREINRVVPDSGPPTNEPMPINEARDSQGDVRNKRDLATRRAELDDNERKMSDSSQKRSNSYRIHLEVKNEGSAIVTSFIWEYQPHAAPSDYKPKQFVCVVKAKPDERKKFDFVVPFAPVKVVNANPKSGKPDDGEVIINSVEYDDGSVWKRKGWSGQLPSPAFHGLGNGKCLEN